MIDSAFTTILNFIVISEQLGDQCVRPPAPKLVEEPWVQSCSSPNIGNSFGGSCGRRTFEEFKVGKNVANPYEFPWTCTIIDENDDIAGLCAVVPENFDNDISEGTRKVLTIASKMIEGNPKKKVPKDFRYVDSFHSLNRYELHMIHDFMFLFSSKLRIRFNAYGKYYLR